ncbi:MULTISPECIES: hypothetical protein [Veillonella]
MILFATLVVLILKK